MCLVAAADAAAFCDAVGVERGSASASSYGEAVAVAVGGLAVLCVGRVSPPCQTLRGAFSVAPVVSVAAYGDVGGVFFSGRPGRAVGTRKRPVCAARRSLEGRRPGLAPQAAGLGRSLRVSAYGRR